MTNKNNGIKININKYKHSMRTKYLKIKDYIETHINKGKHGQLLPTEKELSKQFSVSHMTVRKVYGYFEKEGLLYRKKGKGTFIRKVNHIQKNLHFFL
ncbi:MAG: GntR family transcriptional regulator, partial [Candidatus Omnitrophica bacterium]|nr:GntR family transcriptional regulator [Candidatus Omnitrophota bacterium]